MAHLGLEQHEVNDNRILGGWYNYFWNLNNGI